MFEDNVCCDSKIKQLSKYISKTEFLFLNRLLYWSSHNKNYGIEKEGRVWIYNSLENWSNQLGVSKSSIRRSIKSLKYKNIINSEYLSPNKRNRTLYYAINLYGIHEYLSQISIVPCVHKHDLKSQNNISHEHMDEHMYIIDNSKQKINKSYKSINKSFKSTEPKFSDSENSVDDTKQKTTIVQDMIKIWNYEFSKEKLNLSKQLARFLVAAFKTKFKSCLKEWKRYLETLKTSVYIMSNKFKLSIWWTIKFITIDRIRAGEFGVNKEKIIVDEDELTQRAINHIESVDESDVCKKMRKKITEILSPATYISWFTHVKFIEIEDCDFNNNKKIIMKAENQFVEDWILQNFADNCELCFFR